MPAVDPALASQPHDQLDWFVNREQQEASKQLAEQVGTSSMCAPHGWLSTRTRLPAGFHTLLVASRRFILRNEA